MIPYGRQNISPEDIRAVDEVLSSPYLTQGPVVRQFEAALEAYVGCSKAVVTNSATSALHLACLALGVGPKDLVWTSAISFVASANAARYCGADVDFVDIEPDTFNMSVAALEQKLVAARKSGQKLPKVLIPVAMAGQSADMKEISALAVEYGFKVLEDASHALGATYRGSKLGACAYSDITVFSFHPVKMITTGEGGACTTNNLELGAKIERLRSHGITREVSEMESPRAIPYYYEQLDLGFNYRMTDLQGSIGLVQLSKLDQFIAERQKWADFYCEQLKDVSWLRMPQIPRNGTHAWQAFVTYVNPKTAPKSRNEIMERLQANGVATRPGTHAVHMLGYYRNRYGIKANDYPGARDCDQNTMAIPLHNKMSAEDYAYVVAAIKAIK